MYPARIANYQISFGYKIKVATAGARTSDIFFYGKCVNNLSSNDTTPISDKREKGLEAPPYFVSRTVQNALRERHVFLNASGR